MLAVFHLHGLASQLLKHRDAKFVLIPTGLKKNKTTPIIFKAIKRVILIT